MPATGTILNSFKATDFSGGLDINTSRAKLAMMANNDRSVVAHNIYFRDDGKARARPGFWMINWQPEFTSGVNGSIRGGYQYTKSDGSTWMIIATATTLFALNSADMTASPITLKTGLTSGARYSFAVYNDTLFIANGVDAPMQFDGVTVTPLGGGAPSTLIQVVVHGNRLFGLATAVPSRVYWSRLNNPLDWTGTDDAGFIDVNPNDGHGLTALVPSINELVMLKSSRAYRLQGIGPATGYTVQDNMVPATGSVGCAWRQAAAFGENDVWYASRVGIHRLSVTAQFGDLSESFVSNNIAPVFTTPDKFDLEDIGPLKVPQLVYEPRTHSLFIPVKTVGPGQHMDTILDYDIALKAWAVWKPPFEFTAIWSACEPIYKDQANANALDPNNRSTLYIGGITDRANGYFVARLEFRADHDHHFPGPSPEWPDGYEPIDIISSFQHVNMLRAPGVSKSPRYLMLRFDERQTRGVYGVEVRIYYDFSPFPAITAIVNQAQLINRIDLSGMCEYMEVQLTAPQFPPLLSYEVFWRFRRQIRRTQTWNFALGPTYDDDQDGLPMPMRGCRLTNTITQSVPDTVVTKLTFNRSVFDTDGFHSIVTNPERITVPLSGKYLVGATVRWDNSVSAKSQRDLAIRLNGTTPNVAAASNTVVPGFSAGALIYECITVTQLTAGDYLEVVVVTTGDGTRAILSYPNDSPVFWIVYLGP